MKYWLALLVVVTAKGNATAQKTATGKRQIVILKADDLMFHDSVNAFSPSETGTKINPIYLA
ncbi:hypothetical protein DYBT9275_01563 [Dyadobacter sp. CECT 9275]|uniref:Uncharacterized protein n=1 Tax=Dyadobacter helix TaxID=2822344 RepID=A0A916JCB8_9BACT|nr:hypothetical protein [Dyadobacter sp. CECT 9275]CAG4995152.1 hypothetical protein DYBT9275_01563 [Dyadobacter sp. CECT 9275]